MTLEVPVREDWRTILTLAQGRDVVLLRLEWNDIETMHMSVARELGIYPGQLFHLHHVHHVAHSPMDLYHGYVEVFIAHRENDIPHGSTQKLVH